MNTLIFDIGRTHKKAVVFGETYEVLYESAVRLEEQVDDDGFVCDDLEAIKRWIQAEFKTIMSHFKNDIAYLNFTSYGASWVHLDEKGKVLSPLYNYLKPFPDNLKTRFDESHDLAEVSRASGSPYSGMLNSGLQLYWLKYCKPEIYNRINFSLHLPQYLSYLFTGKCVNELSSLGCHTMLWDLSKGNYHHWVLAEGLNQKLPSLVHAHHLETTGLGRRLLKVGPGFHDSSASLFPYFRKTKEPFLLLSTGTWNVVLNPFGSYHGAEGLYYLTVEGKPVKASRSMLGKELEVGVKNLSKDFGVSVELVQNMGFDPREFDSIKNGPEKKAGKNLSESYHRLVYGIVQKQKEDVLRNRGPLPPCQVFIEGGFKNNAVFLEMLQQELIDWEIVPSEQKEGTALGAAMILH